MIFLKQSQKNSLTYCKFLSSEEIRQLKKTLELQTKSKLIIIKAPNKVSSSYQTKIYCKHRNDSINCQFQITFISKGQKFKLQQMQLEHYLQCQLCDEEIKLREIISIINNSRDQIAMFIQNQRKMGQGKDKPKVLFRSFFNEKNINPNQGFTNNIFIRKLKKKWDNTINEIKTKVLDKNCCFQFKKKNIKNQKFERKKEIEGEKSNYLRESGCFNWSGQNLQGYRSNDRKLGCGKNLEEGIDGISQKYQEDKDSTFTDYFPLC